jgi:hypothetical protein
VSGSLHGRGRQFTVDRYMADQQTKSFFPPAAVDHVRETFLLSLTLIRPDITFFRGTWYHWRSISNIFTSRSTLSEVANS